jgi:hypothetical protein
MASVVVGQAGVVTFQGSPTIVGAAPQWADDSDASYVALTTQSAVATDWAMADLDAVLLAASRFDIYIRATSTDTETDAIPRGPELVWSIEAWNVGLGGIFEVPADGGFHELRATLTDADATFGTYTPAVLAEDIGNGLADLRAFTNAGGVAEDIHTITVYEWQLIAVVIDSPLRKYPRHDGRGMSPVRRGYPPNPAPRLIGGQP